MVKETLKNTPESHELSPNEARQRRKLEAFYLTNGDRSYIFDHKDVRIDRSGEEKVKEILVNGQFSVNRERELLSDIKGPVDQYGEDRIYDERISGNKHEQRILASMTGTEWNRYNEVSGENVARFVERFETPMDFEEESQKFLDMIRRANGDQKYEEYLSAMESFKRKIYGKKQEYWEGMKALHAEAEAEAEKDVKIYVPSRERRANRPAEHAEEAPALPRERLRKLGERVVNAAKNLAPNGERMRSGEKLVVDFGAAVLNKGDLIGRPNRKCEDNLFMSADEGVFAVFDGAGGGGGDPAKASEIAVREMDRMMKAAAPETEKDLGSMLSVINSQINRDSIAGISTGVIGRVIEQDGKKKLLYASVGDSRIYVIRKGEAYQVTSDEGFGNVITNALGSDDFRMRQTGAVELRKGDRLLFCSDGITGDYEKDFIPTKELAAIIEKAKSPREAASALARRATKVDDRTAIVVNL